MIIGTIITVKGYSSVLEFNRAWRLSSWSLDGIFDPPESYLKGVILHVTQLEGHDLAYCHCRVLEMKDLIHKLEIYFSSSY